MLGFIIWIAVIAYIVIRCTKNAKKDQRQSKPNVPRNTRPPQYSQPRMQGQRPPQQRMPQYNNPQMQGQRPVKQSVPQQAKRTQPQPAAQPSILQKAKANAAQQFDDDTKPVNAAVELGRLPVGDEIMKDKAKARHIHSEHEDGHETELRNQLGVDDLDTYHLMDEVNDLIVKGYSGNLEFQRDFVAEATDMLNRMYG